MVLATQEAEDSEITNQRRTQVEDVSLTVQRSLTATTYPALGRLDGTTSDAARSSQKHTHTQHDKSVLVNIISISECDTLTVLGSDNILNSTSVLAVR